MGTIIRHTFLDSNGIRMHVTDAGHGYPVLLLHGFPELWYSWRRQISALADAGFRVLVPDLRGYGGTDAPEEVESYVMRELVEDLIGICDAVGVDNAAVVGHDWGGALAWHFALRHPERCGRVISLNTPFLAPGPKPPTIAMRDALGLTDETFYMRYFQKPGVAEQELEADARETFQKMFRGAKHADELLIFATVGGDGSSLLGKIGPGESLLSRIDLDTYARIYKRTGFRGGLNWYRAADLSWEEDKDLPSFDIDVPAMLVVAKHDRILRPELAEATKQYVKNLRVEQLDCSHWTQQEKPNEVNALLLDFFKDLKSPSAEVEAV